MLEHLGHESNSVLLLPIPYDDFTRDLVKLLKTLLTGDGNIHSACCFDPEVQAQYDKRKDSLVDSIVTDKFKIVIFLCLKSVDDIPQPIPDCVVYKLLERCQKQNPAPASHVLFLHVTDKVKDLQNKYHGIDIHIKHDKSYESFLKAILEGCGQDPDTESKILQRMLDSETSQDFFKHIGHQGT